jgi:energy-coupling factor transporter ATP-binding protein EcfA2
MDGKEHVAWLSLVEIDGRFITVGALEAAEAHLTHPVDEIATSLRALTDDEGRIADIRAFLHDVLGWTDEFFVPHAEMPGALRSPSGGGRFLAPRHDLRSADEPGRVAFIVQETERGEGFNKSLIEGELSAGKRFEHLLRETGVEVGLLTNGRSFRIVYAPRNERPGAITFDVAHLLTVDGRPLLAALHMLLNERRLLSLPPDKRLLGLLRTSRAYKVKRLVLRSFGAFEDVELSFAGGVNVFIGANGTGKTHVMKALYAAVNPFEHRGDPVPLEVRLLGKFANVFKPDKGQVGRLVRRGGAGEARVMLEGDVGKIELSLLATEEQPLRLITGEWPSATSVVYLPARDVLAMYEGFIAAYQDRELSFDETFYDICVALGAAPLRGSLAEEAVALAAPLEKALGGKVVLRGNRFYVENGDDLLEAHLVAEGLRKCASLMQLISNGSLTAEGLFFWDEPETNLNPRLITLAADLLLDLASLGVQVFVTTHDYLLSHRLSLVAEYKKRPDVPIRFFAFHREDGRGPVRVNPGGILAELPDNPIIEEFTKHYDFERDLFDEAVGGGATP